MSEWLPIETAPKDDTEFLAYDSRTKRMDVCVMSNLYGPNDWLVKPVQSDPVYGTHEDEFGHRSVDITHWMPLPEPPNSAPAGSDDASQAIE